MAQMELLIQGHLDIFQLQVDGLHALLTSAEHSKQITLSRQHCKRKRCIEAHKSLKAHVIQSDYSLVSTLTRDGCVCRIEPFLQSMVDTIASYCYEAQAIWLLTLQKTVTKKKNQSIRLIRSGAVTLLKILIQSLLVSSSIGDLALLELLEIALETLVVLPYEAMVVQRADLLRLVSRLEELQFVRLLPCGTGLTHRLTSLASKVKHRLSKSHSGPSQSEVAERLFPVDFVDHAASDHVGRAEAHSKSAHGNTDNLPASPQKEGRPIHTRRMAPKTVVSDSRDFEPKLASDVVPSVAGPDEVEEERRRREQLRNRGKGGGIQLIFPQVSNVAPTLATSTETSALEQCMHSTVETAGSSTLPKMQMPTAQAQTKRVKWLDRDGGQDLLIPHYFGNGLHELELSSGPELVKEKEAHKTRHRELARKEHLSERALVRRKHGSLSEEKAEVEKATSGNVSILRDHWLRPRQILWAEASKVPRTRESRLQDSRLRTLFEIIYRDAEIPYTPTEKPRVRRCEGRSSAVAAPVEELPWGPESPDRNVDIVPHTGHVQPLDGNITNLLEQLQTAGGLAALLGPAAPAPPEPLSLPAPFAGLLGPTSFCPAPDFQQGH